MFSHLPCSRSRRPVSVCFLGLHGSGKSTLINSFGTLQDFSKFQSSSAFGVTFESQFIVLESGVTVKFNVSEVAGHECFNSAAYQILEKRNVDACVIVFDITSRDSFDTAIDWLQQCVAAKNSHHNCNEMQIVLVGNKKDLRRWRAVKTEEAATLAESLDVYYTETSAIHNNSGKKIFKQIAQQHYYAHYNATSALKYCP